MDAKTDLLNLLKSYESPERMALSTRFPILKKPIIFLRRLMVNIKNAIIFDIAHKKSTTFFTNVIARHQSVLIRKLGNSDQKLQKNKIINLKRACEDLNGLIINPSQVFSLWSTIGNPTYKKGYTDGMLLSNGKIIEGVGGGLCQLSNFLCWLLLHAHTKIIERYHHSMDVFPDSGRVLPFGSGATCLFNFVDLKVKNISPHPLQLKIWLTDTHLKGRILCNQRNEIKFSIKEKNHIFIKRDEKYFRYNEIWRMAKIEGKEVWKEKIFTNFAPVLYEVSPEYFLQHNHQVINLSND